MKYLRVDENEGIGIIKAIIFLLMMFAILILTSIVTGLIVGILMILISAMTGFSFDAFKPYIDLLAEIIGYMVIVKLYVKTQRRDLGKIDVKLIWVMLFGVLGYRFLYDSTFAVILNPIPTAEWLEDIIIEKAETPLILIIHLTMIAPIFEEIIFRGFFLKRFIPSYGVTKAIIISSFLFAIIHGNIHQGVNAFVIGIIIGYVYVKTGSLLTCIWIHFVNNAFLVISFYIPYDLFAGGEQFDIFNFMLGTVLVLISISIWMLVRPKKSFSIENG